VDEINLLLRNFSNLPESLYIKAEIESDELVLNFSKKLEGVFVDNRWVNGQCRGIVSEERGLLQFEPSFLKVKEHEMDLEHIADYVDDLEVELQVDEKGEQEGDADLDSDGLDKPEVDNERVEAAADQCQSGEGGRDSTETCEELPEGSATDIFISEFLLTGVFKIPPEYLRGYEEVFIENQELVLRRKKKSEQESILTGAEASVEESASREEKN